MISLIQRVSRAQVSVDGALLGRIGPGLLVLAAVQRGDGEAQARRMADRLAAYRVFPDGEGRMNLDVNQAGGGILLVPQFTLAADTRKGNRPSLGRAAEPAVGAGPVRNPGGRGPGALQRSGHGAFRCRYGRGTGEPGPGDLLAGSPTRTPGLSGNVRWRTRAAGAFRVSLSFRAIKRRRHINGVKSWVWAASASGNYSLFC